jgi:hypothetical protein
MPIEIDAPTIGHNAAPSDADVLRDRLEAENADLIARLAALLQSAKMAPEFIADDDTAGRVADLCKMFTALEKSVAERQAAECKPLADTIKAVRAFFTTRLADDDASKTLRARLLARLKAKAADSDGVVRVRGDNGSVATLTRPIIVSIEDRDKLDLDTLRPFIDDEALLKAARAFFKSRGLLFAGARIERGYGVTIS